MTPEAFGYFGGQDELFVAASREACEECLGDGIEIFHAFAQGGHGEADDVEAIEEVGAEEVFADHGFKVAVCGGDDPDVDGDGVEASEGLDFFFFEDAQQATLRLEWEFADFVEEQGAVGGGFDDADLAFVGTGEGALFVAEEFAFDEIFGDGGTVQRHEALATAWADVVNGTRDDFFAASRFAANEDTTVGGGDLHDDLAHLDHGGALTNEAAFEFGGPVVGRSPRGGVGIGGGAGEGVESGGGIGGSAGIDGGLDFGDELGQIEGLGDVVGGAVFKGADGTIDGSEGCDEQHSDVGGGVSEAGQDFHAVDAWHHDVAQHDIGLEHGNLMECFDGIAELGDAQTFSLQDLRDDPDHFFFVVDDHHMGGGGGFGWGGAKFTGHVGTMLLETE